VGYGTIDGGAHALRWNGTAESVVDLHPVGFHTSYALDVSGASQVGYGFGLQNHALLWNGTAESVVDLHPVGFDSSQALGVSGTRQVGWGSVGLQNHALLWNGTAESVVDLHPVGYEVSYGEGISDAGQVGQGSGPATGGWTHALLWRGTADSVIDLHTYLAGLGPSFYQSSAKGISDDGSIVGNASAIEHGFYKHYVVLWTPIPEPSTAALFACGMIAVAIIRHRQRL
jgi:hypothetical protein